MKVKIGNKIYNSVEEPIMVIFEDDDKINISMMSDDNHRYCSFPSNLTVKNIEDFMKTD
jgi:hypothetical protein